MKDYKKGLSALIVSMIITSAVLISIGFVMAFNIGSFLVFVPIGTALIVIWSALIKKINTYKKKKKVFNEGKTFTANFVSIITVKQSESIRRCYINYAWKDELGQSHQDKSYQSFSPEEAEAYKKTQFFEIKALKDDSIIITKPSDLNMKNAEKYEKKTTCNYCGSVFEDSEDKCPYCGATKKLRKK